MNIRKPTATQSDTTSSSTMLLLELEIPRTTALEAFEEWFDAELEDLEKRFRDFVTRGSLAGSIGR